MALYVVVLRGNKISRLRPIERHLTQRYFQYPTQLTLSAQDVDLSFQYGQYTSQIRFLQPAQLTLFELILNAVLVERHNSPVWQ